MMIPPTDTKLPVPTNREQLLEALDSEIASINSKQSAEGFSHWALLGAMAAALWLAMDYYEKASFQQEAVFLLTLSIWVLAEALTSIIRLMEASPRHGGATARFHPAARMLGSTRPVFLFHVVRNFCFLFCLYYFRGQISWVPWQFAIMCALCAYEVIALTLGIIFAFTDFPITFQLPQNAARTSLHLEASLATFFIASPVLICWGTLWQLNRGFLEPQNLRLALLLTATLYLIRVVGKLRVSANHLESLRDIRQGLAFGRITLHEARTQVDLLLLGSTLAEILQPKVADLFAAYERLSGTLASAPKTAASIEEIARAISELDPKDCTLLLNLHTQLASRCAQAQAEIDAVEPYIAELKRKLAKFKHFCTYLFFVSRADRSGLANYRVQLEAATARVLEAQTSAATTIAKAKALLDKAEMPRCDSP